MKIYSIHFNRPDFVKIQFDLSLKFGYDLVIVNNGSNPDIKKVSNEIGVEYIETENISTGSRSHGNSINQIIKKIDMSADWGIIDHDLFFIKNIKFSDFDIISWKQENVPSKEYLWPGLLLCRGGVDLSYLDFLPGVNIPGDTGCSTYEIVDKYRIKWSDTSISWKELSSGRYQNENIIIDFSLDGDIIAHHYLNGSNWIKSSNNEIKNKMLIDSINNKL
jgi:hypothetical protein